jgi:diphthamide synthase (EF-2-diphthine--ammonia ligase)
VERPTVALARSMSAGVDACGENGEFHSCAGPMFRAHIAMETGETVERDGFVFTDLCRARDPEQETATIR